MMQVYFAHPISDYGTEWQAAAIRAIRAAPEFEAWEIVNPNRPEFDAGYKAFGMQFFIERCDKCDAVVAAPFPDGSFGAGVGKEVLSFMMRRRPIYLIDRETLRVAQGMPGPFLSIDQTRERVAHYRSNPSPSG